MRTTLSDRITALLEEHPGLSAREVSEQLSAKCSHIRAAICRMRSAKELHISGWRRDEDGGRLYIRALYSLGDKRDAKKPPPLSNTEYCRRWFKKKARAVNSVFALGLPIIARTTGPLSDQRTFTRK